MNIATAFVEIRADDAKLKKDLADVEADVKAKAGSTAKVFAQVFSAAAFGAVVKGSIDAASDLNETVSKTKTLFGDNSDAVIAFSKTTAQSMGLSQRAYLDAAAGLKGLLDNLGLAPAQATEWSQKLTQLGSDLGSFFNKDPAVAIEAIGSAIRGESEPIRAFNVQINEAAIKQKALELGLYAGVGAIDSNAKAQATLALIMDQTTAAQGDFAKTADGAANSQRIAKATMEDSAASLGQAFLPIYTKIVQVVTKLAEGFGALPAPVQVGLVAMAGWVALSGPIKVVTDHIKLMTDRIKALGPNATSAAAGIGVFAGVALVGLALHAKAAADRAKDVAVAISEISRATTDAAAVEEFFKFLGANLLTGDDAMKKLAESNLEGAKRILEVGAASGVQKEGLDLLRVAVEAEDAARAAATETQAKYGAATEDTTVAIAAQAPDLIAQQQALDLTRQAQERAAAATEANEQATSDLSDSLDDSTTSFSEAAEAANALRSAIDAVFGGTQNMEEANRNLQAEIDATTASIKENGKTLDIGTEKGRANREQIEKHVDKIIDYGVALVGSGKSNKEATDAITVGTAALKEQLSAAGLTEAQVDEYIKTLGLTPENVRTAIELVDDDIAKAKLADIIAQIGVLDAGAAAEIQALTDEGSFATAEARLREIARARNITLNLVPGAGWFGEVKINASAGKFTPTAIGGIFDQPSRRLVGESGIEAVLPLSNPSRLAQLLSDPRVGNPIAASMASRGNNPGWGAGSTWQRGGGGGDAPVIVNVYGAERSYIMDLAREIDNIRKEGR